MDRKHRTDWHPEARRVWEAWGAKSIELHEHRDIIEDAIEAQIILCGEQFTAEQLDAFIERELTFAAGVKALAAERGAAVELRRDKSVPPRTVPPASELRHALSASPTIEPASELRGNNE